jgi:DNA-directed RNA polymerase specialized sigma24 family protein
MSSNQTNKSQTDYKKLHSIFTSLAHKMFGHDFDRESIVQEALLSILNYERTHGKISSQNYRHSLIDAYRKLYGDSRRALSVRRQSIERNILGKTSCFFENSEEWRLPSEADPRANETCRNDFDQLDLTPGQSEIFSLLESGKYDDQSDVAFVLGVDPSVIFAQTWQVRNKIKKQKEEKKLLAKKKQLLDKGLEINWVKLSIV